MKEPEGDARHFETGHLDGQIVSRSMRGGVVTLVSQALKVLIQFVAIVILARLLAPADFGLFAMIAAFLAIFELVKDLGLSTATIQRSSLTHRQVSTLFWLNGTLGIGIALLTAAAAPLFAWLYGEPALLHIVPVVAVSFLFTGFAAQHLALLRRQMRFTAVALVQFVSEAAALGLAVAAALAGLGFWALVVQRLLWAAMMMAGGWALCRWRPGRPGPFAEVRALVVFGANATGAMTLGALAGNLDKIVIGWYWGSGPLGLFERAQKLLHQPIQNLNIPLATVALPALSRLAGTPAAYRDAYLAVIRRLSMLMAPLAAVMVAAAEPIVALVLGAQWTAVAPALAWMAVSLIYMPAAYALGWLYMSQDRTPEMLRAGAVNGALAALAVLAGVPFGIVGVAAAATLSLILVRGPVMFWFAGRRGPVSILDLYRVLGTPTLATLAGTAAVVAFREAIPMENASPLLVVAVAGLVAASAALVVYAMLPDSRRVLASLQRLPAHLLGREARA